MKKLLLFLLLFLLPLIFLFSENFTIEGYDIEIDVKENRVYSIKEHLVLDYTTPSHGFYRSIPFRYRDDFKAEAIVDNINVSEPFSIEKNGDYLDLKIGSADTLVSGKMEYFISYDYDLGDDGYKDYDEFYFNMIGDEWDTEIRNISFKVTFPKPVSKDLIWFNTGSYGTIGADVDVRFEDEKTVSGSIGELNAGNAATLRVQMDEGYFVNARVKKDYSAIALSVFIILSFAFIVLYIFLHRKYGVDKSLAVVVGFDPPDDLTPLQCGYVIDQSADDRDVASMIFYWADKGYLSIEEKKGSEFIFHKLKELPSTASKAETILFDALFGNGAEASTTTLEKGGFAKTVNEVVKPQIKSYFVKDRALIDKKSLSMKSLVGILSFLFVAFYSFAVSVYDNEWLVFVLAFSFGFLIISFLFANIIKQLRYDKKMKRALLIILYALIAIVSFPLNMIVSSFGNTNLNLTFISLLLCYVVAFLGSFGGILMERLSSYGLGTIEKVLGYKEFIDKVEVDKLKLMIETDPEYFYHVLSFAICFGLEEKWAKKFKNIFIEPASWYTSPSPIISYYAYTSMYRRWNTAYRNTILPASYPKSTSGHGGSSSFSGSSGFSGGGFGGGGGRSW